MYFLSMWIPGTFCRFVCNYTLLVLLKRPFSYFVPFQLQCWSVGPSSFLYHKTIFSVVCLERGLAPTITLGPCKVEGQTTGKVVSAQRRLDGLYINITVDWHNIDVNGKRLFILPPTLRWRMAPNKTCLMLLYCSRSIIHYVHLPYTGWRKKKRGHPISLQIFWKFHNRIAWKLVNFCNIICW